MKMRSTAGVMSVAGLALALSLAGCGRGDDRAGNANNANNANAARNTATASNLNTNAHNSPVASSPPETGAQDTALKNKVEANLTKYGVSGVTAEVSNGVVTLKGSVPEAKFQDAVKAANEAWAQRVLNQLSKR